jgi:ligand-binding sensor domain-containing protein
MPYFFIITALIITASPVVLYSQAALRWQSLAGPNGGIGNDLLETTNSTYIATNGGIYCRKAGAWQSLALLNEQVLYLAPLGDSALIAANEQTVWFQADTGWYSTSILPEQKIIGLFTTAGGTIFAILEDSGVYVSTDSAKSWQQKNYGLSGLKIRSGVANDIGLIWLATSYGVFYSQNGGNIWLSYAGGMPFIETKNVFLNPFTQTLFVTRRDSAGIARKERGEPLWQWADSTLDINTVAFDPEGNCYSGSTDGKLYYSATDGQDFRFMGLLPYPYPIKKIIARSGGRLLAIQENRGIVSSADSGKTWTLTNEGLFASDVVQLSALPNGILWAASPTPGSGYSKFENQWQRKEQTALLSRLCSGLAINSDTLFIGGLGGQLLYRSIDGGNSWQPLWPTGDNRIGIQRIFYDPYRKRVYVSTYSQELYYSADWGISWQITASGLPRGVSDMAFSENFSLVANRLGIFKLDVQGLQWQPFDAGLPPQAIISLATNAKAQKIIATTTSGIFELMNNRWVQIFSNTGKYNFTVCTVDDSGNYFAGTDRAGIFYKLQTADSWQPLNDGLPNNCGIRSLIISPENKLIAGSSSSGVWESTVLDSLYNAATAGSEQLPAAVLFELYPNPLTDKLYFTRKEAHTPAQLTIISLTGQIYYQLQLPPGLSTVAIDIALLPSGSYCLQYQSSNRYATQRIIKITNN